MIRTVERYDRVALRLGTDGEGRFGLTIAERGQELNRQMSEPNEAMQRTRLSSGR